MTHQNNQATMQIDLTQYARELTSKKHDKDTVEESVETILRRIADLDTKGAPLGLLKLRDTLAQRNKTTELSSEDLEAMNKIDGWLHTQRTATKPPSKQRKPAPRTVVIARPVTPSTPEPHERTQAVIIALCVPTALLAVAIWVAVAVLVF